MPIKGKVLATYPHRYVMDSSQGILYYLYHEYLTVTREAVFLDLFSPICLRDEIDDEDIQEYVTLTRIGEGFTEKDFEIDISEIDTLFVLEPKTVYDEYKKSSEFIAFENVEVELTKIKIDSLDESIDDLDGKKLKELKGMQDDLTDEMIELQKNTSSENLQERKKKMQQTQEKLDRVIAMIEEKQKK
jgi:hypothetical protein